ncbi:MAG TPA: RHS repeat-associated core domain-containing protein [Gammaproteobacteria bacterium]
MKQWVTYSSLFLSSLFAVLLLSTGVARAGKITVYVHTDHLGNPVAKTDSTGVVIWRQSYTPYGETEQGQDPNGPGFTGHRNDAATDLVYMQARYYDPVVARFLSVDQVTFSPDNPEHFNRYWYADGNPFLNVDPDGKNPFNFNFMPTQTTNASALTAATHGVAAEEFGDAVVRAANYPARQITGNSVTAIASALSVVPLLAPVTGPIAVGVGAATAADKAAHEGLDSNDKLGLVVTAIPAANALKAIGATSKVVAAVKADAALLGVTVGVAGAAAAKDNADAQMDEKVSEEALKPDGR